MGLKKAYDELTDNPEFSDGLVLPNGQTILDSDGDAILSLDGTGRRYFNSPEGKKVYLQDTYGGFIAAEYIPSDASPGTLELTNALLEADGDADVVGTTSVGIVVRPSSTTFSQKIAFDNDSGETSIIFERDTELVAQDSAGNETTLT